MIAHRVAQQLVAHQAVEAVEALAHTVGPRRKVDACRRAQAEHPLRLVQQADQALERGRVKGALHPDPPPAGQLRP